MSNVRCPNCKNRLLGKSAETGEMRVRITGYMAIDETDGLLKAQCHFCKAEVKVPLELSKAALPKPRLIVRKT
jgi:hypothetical protein